jgi:hypothetical protein
LRVTNYRDRSTAEWRYLNAKIEIKTWGGKEIQNHGYWKNLEKQGGQKPYTYNKKY